MLSQNAAPRPLPPTSPTLAAGGREPKRKRGHIRVAAIMQAGVEVFKEKGYDAATMTEIAARSGTAIASLYRFFPSKEALADALLQQYAQHALERLSEVRQRVAGLTPGAIAAALIDFRLELQSQRRFAIDLVDARGASDTMQRQFRKAMLAGLAGILRDAVPGITKAKSQVMAIVLLHVLKGVAMTDLEKPAARRTLLAELEELLRAYLASVRAAKAK